MVVRAARDRLEAVLADLPPPLYVAGEMVQSEPLSDHDVKRLLNAYGARVTRQAPVTTTTSALRVVGKLGTPVWVLPGLPPGEEVTAIASVETKDGLLCETQAEVKRQTALLLGRYEYVLLREVTPRGSSLRIRLRSERGLGSTLRVEPLLGDDERSEATLLPMFADDAQALAQSWACLLYTSRDIELTWPRRASGAGRFLCRRTFSCQWRRERNDHSVGRTDR